MNFNKESETNATLGKDIFAKNDSGRILEHLSIY